MIIDGSNTIMGKLASYVATRVLQGERVSIVNCEKVVISGDPKQILKDFKRKIEKGTTKRGPFIPKNPAGLMRRAVRGMLPYKKERGRKAYSLVKCYVGIPKEFEGKQISTLEEFNAKRLKTDYITLGKLCRQVGGYSGGG